MSGVLHTKCNIIVSVVIRSTLYGFNSLVDILPKFGSVNVDKREYSSFAVFVILQNYLLFYTLANICNIGDIVLTLLPGYLARRARVYDGNSIYDGHLGGGGGYL